MRYGHLPDRDWRIWVAALVAAVWLGVGIIYGDMHRFAATRGDQAG